ncbi:unnamed protein product [Pylaiella littoralis]
MNNITIDASTGDIVVKSMTKCIMPNLHDSSILKSVRRILEDNDGPKMSTRLINGRQMSIATLGLCYDILEKMNGPNWRKWRQESEQAFNHALRERVEHVRSSAKRSNPSHGNSRFARVETKAVVRQKALRSINIDGSVRIDEASGRASDLVNSFRGCKRRQDQRRDHRPALRSRRIGQASHFGSTTERMKRGGPMFRLRLRKAWSLEKLISTTLANRNWSPWGGSPPSTK